MARKYLTDKEKRTIEEILKRGLKNVTAQVVLTTYDCKDIKSAYQIAYKLKSNELFQNELKKRQLTIQTVIQNEGKKLVDILEEIFPKVERAKILVEIAKTGDIKSKLEALKEINKIGAEYKVETEQPKFGGLQIVMMKPPEATQEKRETLKVVEINKSVALPDRKRERSEQQKEVY